MVQTEEEQKALLAKEQKDLLAKELKALLANKEKMYYNYFGSGFYCGSNVMVRQHEIEQACRINKSLKAPAMKIGAIVQVYNHASQAQGVVDSLVIDQAPIEEVIVIDDGSNDGSLEAYQRAFAVSLTKREKNPHVIHRLIRGNNVHEIRNYNRGMELMMNTSKNIDLFALMQDDDVLFQREWHPWAQQAVELFDRLPRLCVLGGYVGYEALSDGHVSGFEYYGSKRSYNNVPMLQIQQMCGNITFQFMMAIASSPMILRKECVQDIGLLSVMVTSPGDPGILFDVEYSLRAWSQGWQVGLYRTGFSHGCGGHSSMISPLKQKQRDAVMQKNSQYLEMIYHRLSMRCHYHPELNETRSEILKEFGQQRQAPSTAGTAPHQRCF